MTTHAHKTAQLGELVAAVFDEAARYSADPREVSRLASRAVSHMVRCGRLPVRASRSRSSRKLGV